MSETNGLVTKPMGMSPSIPDRRTKNLAEVVNVNQKVSHLLTNF